MKYIIVIDKQSCTNPSLEKREIPIEVDNELRKKGDIKDEIIVEDSKAKYIKRIGLSKYNVSSVLDEPIEKELPDVKLPLFEGDNYIYIKDEYNNQMCAEYLVKNDFTDIYVTKLEMSSAIEQTAESIDLSVNKKLEGYSNKEEMQAAISIKINEITSTVATKEELNTAKTEIKQTTDSITSEVSKKVNNSEFSTILQQDSESIQIAWNKITDYIQFINAQLQIKDNNKKLLSVIDKTGQHFYSNSGKVFGDMGVKIVNDQNYITFSVPTDYGKSISDGMAWGITTSSDNKFFPVLFIKNFKMGSKNAGDFSGELVLNAGDFVLQGLDSGIISGNIKICGGTLNNVEFIDTTSSKTLLSIYSPNSSVSGLESGKIEILDQINFFANEGGSNTLKVGENEEYCLLTGDGYFIATQHATIGNEVNGGGMSVYGESFIHNGSLTIEKGNIYAKNISSDRRLKEDIKNTNISALEKIKKIKHKQFIMKEDGKHYDIGYIAQELEKIDENFVLKRKTIKGEEIKGYQYYINELPIIATITKGIQELMEKNEKQECIIKNLIKKLDIVEEKDRWKKSF